MGGIGKTALSVKLAKQLVENQKWGVGSRESETGDGEIGRAEGVEQTENFTSHPYPLPPLILLSGDRFATHHQSTICWPI